MEPFSISFENHGIVAAIRMARGGKVYARVAAKLIFGRKMKSSYKTSQWRAQPRIRAPD
jgi:hypothetical protein